MRSQKTQESRAEQKPAAFRTVVDAGLYRIYLPSPVHIVGSPAGWSREEQAHPLPQREKTDAFVRCFTLVQQTVSARQLCKCHRARARIARSVVPHGTASVIGKRHRMRARIARAHYPICAPRRRNYHYTRARSYIIFLYCNTEHSENQDARLPATHAKMPPKNELGGVSVMLVLPCGMPRRYFYFSSVVCLFCRF